MFPTRVQGEDFRELLLKKSHTVAKILFWRGYNS